MKKIIGLVLFALPLIGLFIFFGSEFGYLNTLRALGGVTLIIGGIASLIIGATLMTE